MNIDLFDYVIERHCLASLIQYNYAWPELQVYIKDSDFYNSSHRTIFNTICRLIESKSETNEVLITGKLKSLGIDQFEDIKMEDYVGSICKIPVSKDAWRDFYKSLLEYRIKRDIYSTGQELQKIAQNTQGIEELIRIADEVYSEKTKKIISINKDEFVDLADGLGDRIEDLGNNPIDETKILYGPFKSVNNLYGSLHRNGNITLIGARSGLGKTAISLHYNIYMAERYNLPILWLDQGELSREEMEIRMAAVFSNGLVPLYAIEYGQWRRNPDWVKAIREGLPRAKKIKLHYQSVSGLSPNQVISVIRRYKYNKVGRENRFLCVYDYLKPFDSSDFQTSEWQQMGKFIKDLKAFIQDEIDNPFFTSIQLNKSGITTNKNSKDVDDSEAAISISDRITQQTSFSCIMRRKTADEMEAEGGRFGNLKMIPVKTRWLGKDAERALNMVKMPNGRYKNNYVNLDMRNFMFEDKGDLLDILPQLNDIYNLAEEGGQEKDEKMEL